MGTLAQSVKLLAKGGTVRDRIWILRIELAHIPPETPVPAMAISEKPGGVLDTGPKGVVRN